MTKKLPFLLACIVALMAISCGDELTSIVEEKKTEYTFEDLKDLVVKDLEQGKTFDWREQETEVIHSAGMLSDSIFSIGYTIDENFDIEGKMHQIDVKSEEWKSAREVLEALIVEMESEARGEDVTMRDLRPFGEVNYFPQIIISTASMELLKALRAHNLVRFVEPIGFSISDSYIANRSGSGCGGDPDYNLNSNDYTVVSPSGKVPWNFYNHQIDQAWNTSAKGNNIKMCVIDSGASDDQDNLGSQFNSGNSFGRNIEKYSTKYSGRWWWRSLDPPHDDCGHGTSMAGLAAAPWSNDGNAVGAAYQCDLMTIRAVSDVLISNSDERSGVRDALYLAGGNSATKVISMSIGTPFYSGTVADGVFYAYNQQKLIFAAAGTSLSWTNWYPVIFPANMSQCRAVTGVQDSESLEECETCHTGSEVDFVLIMERHVDTDRHSLGLALYSNQPKYIGGSSAATATTAGIATMVWGENPSASRAQVLDAMKTASSIFPNRHPDFGWGLINAQQAVSNL